MKEICKLAQEKRFKAKTVSTQVAYKFHLGIGKNMMLNDMCDYLLLCEIQKWIREEFNSIIFIFNRAKSEWNFTLSEDNISGASSRDYIFITYGEALKAGIKEALKIN